MTPSGKSVAVIVLSYLLFGLFNWVQFGAFVVPVTYTPLVVFAIIGISFVQNSKKLTKKDLFLFVFALSGLILHPFLWEITLSQQQQFVLYNHIGFEIIKIVQWVSLTIFFILSAYQLQTKKLLPEWLLLSMITLGCLFNPPSWYFSGLFILSGIIAFLWLRTRDDSHNFLMEILVGIGIIQLVNIFYLI